MLRDFAKLSLWNVLLCIFYRSESVGFLLSVAILSLLVTVLIIFDVIGSKYNYTLLLRYLALGELFKQLNAIAQQTGCPGH